jgi:hypothetical protein
MIFGTTPNMPTVGTRNMQVVSWIEDESALFSALIDDRHCFVLFPQRVSSGEWYSSSSSISNTITPTSAPTEENAGSSSSSDTSTPTSAPTEEHAGKASGAKVTIMEAAAVAVVRRGLRGVN